jgi:ketosteroid isomerase-like protein
VESPKASHRRGRRRSAEPTIPDPVELTERLVEAFDRGDVDAIAGLGAEDAVLEATAFGLRFEGVEAVRSFVEEWFGSFVDLAFELLEVRDLASGVVFAVIRQSGSPVGALGSIEQSEGWAIAWENGLITQAASYIDIDQARADRRARTGAEQELRPLRLLLVVERSRPPRRRKKTLRKCEDLARGRPDFALGDVRSSHAQINKHLQIKVDRPTD